MKRKVRITPPASNPFESNSMSTWMAEMGGTQPRQEDQIVYAAAEMLSQGIPQDEVIQTLIEQGIPVATIDEVMNSLYQYVEEQRDLSEANYLGDKLTQEQILADQEMAQRDMMYEQDMSEDDSPMYYSPDTDPGYAEEDAVMDEVLMKFGGKIPTKGQYIKKQLKLKRKQEGGPEESNKADDTLSEKRPINKFIQKVTEIAQEKLDKESLEEEYNQMFSNQMFDDEELPEAQFGGGRNARRAQRQQRRATKKMNRMLPNGFDALSQFIPSQPNIVGGLNMFSQNFGINPMMNQNIQLANVQVHRSGLFGKPKEYTINFNTAPPVKNDYEDLVKQEIKNAETTIEEKKEEEKEKETTTASAENEKVQEELITADQIEVVGSGKTTTKNTTSIKPQLKKDAWGRSEDDEWYGFDPNQGKFSTRDVVQPIIDYAKRPQGPKLDNVQTTSWTDNSIDPNSELGKLIKLKEDFAHQGISEKQNPALVDINKRINDLKSKYNNSKNKTAKPTASTSSSSIFQSPYLQFANNFLFQKGGFTDQNSGLYKFIGGGDDTMIPFADESFRFNSEDTTDPYFKNGGLIKAQTGYWKNNEWIEGMDPRNVNELTNNPKTNLSSRDNYEKAKAAGINVGDFREGIDYSKIGNKTTTQQQKQQQQNYYNPQIGAMYPPLFGGRRSFRPPGRAIEYAGSWTQQKGMPFDPRTGKPIMGIPSSSAPISKIDVTKSSLLRKRPKEYTVYYGNQGTGQAPTTTSKTSGSKVSGSNESQDQLRQYSGFQNVLAQIPGLSKFVNDPKGDYVSTDGMVSPKDYQGVGKLQTKTANLLPTSADELRSRQDAALIGNQSNLPLRRNLLPTSADEPREPIVRDFSTSNNIAPPDFEDELNNEIVDIIPEDLSNEYTGLPSELAVNRNSQTVSPIVNTAGPMNESNYSYDMPGEGENYIDEYEKPYSFKRDEMLESLGRGPSNVPFYPIGENAPLIGPDAASEYVDERLNYNMDLPNQTELPEGRFTQKMVDDSQKRFEKRQAAVRRDIERQKEKIKNETRKEVKQQDNIAPKETILNDTKEDTIKNFKSRPLTRAQRLNLENQVKDWDEFQNSGLELEQYLYLKNTGKNIPNIKASVNKKWDDYQKWAKENTPRGSLYKQYGGANYTYPQLPVAQTLGQFNMSTPYANKNTDVLPDDSQIPIMKPKSSKEVWETTEPEIRESWGLEPKTEPELQYDPYAVKYKNRDMYNVDFEKGVNKFNTRANMLLAATGERGDAQRETQLFNDLTADNIFASTNRQKRGTFDPLSGILEPDKMGFRGVAQYGGFMQNGGDVYDEDDETWMSEDQIRQFLAEGGELEFI
jgi:hypothetical protein